MKLLDILRKLGILRFGAEAGVYASGADRPTSLMMDGVYDSQKDLVTREDLARVREGLAKQTGQPAHREFAAESGGTVIDTDDPRYWEIFFEIHSGLHREAPGNEASTRKALSLLADLPSDPLVLDLGCGPGATALLLARETGGRVVGLDLHRPFPREVRERAGSAGLGDRVFAVNGNMESAPFAPATFDLVWSEGALYSAGVPRGLAISRDALKPDGHLAFTEAVWLETEPPEEARRWWENEYPDIATVDANLGLIVDAGLSSLDHFTLPGGAWWEYYGPLEEKLEELRRRHAGDPVALDVLEEAQVEVDMYRTYGRSYGYEFFICRKR